MTEPASLKFQREILSNIEYFRKEFDLTYEAAIGVLDIVKHRLLVEANFDRREEEDETGDADE